VFSGVVAGVFDDFLQAGPAASIAPANTTVFQIVLVAVRFIVPSSVSLWRPGGNR
jgi:hypothetical protein